MPKKTFSTSSMPFRAPTNAGNRQRRSRKQNAGSGGGGGNRHFASKSLEIDGENFYLPDGLPFEWEKNRGDAESKELVVRGSEFYLNTKQDDWETVVILAPFYHKHGTHSPQVLVNTSVLPSDLQGLMARYPKAPLWRAHLCTSDVEGADFPSFEDWEPSDDWADDGEGMALTKTDHLSVSIYMKGDYWAVQPPSLHASLVKKDFEPFEHEDSDESMMLAMYHAELLLHQAGGCGHCMQVQYERSNKVKGKKRTVWPVRTEIFIPMFDLRWLQGVDPTDDKSGKFAKADSDWVPEEAEFAARSGWASLRCPEEPSSSSSKHRTFEEYKAYLMKLYHRCGNCMEDGKEESPHDHKITIKSLCCRNCGADLYDKRTIARADMSREMKYDSNGDPIPGEAGLYEMVTEPVECSECGHHDIPEPELSCNTCDEPTPIGPHQVLTRVSITESKHFQFEVADDYFGDEDLQFIFNDFTEFPVFNGFETDEELYATVEAAYGVVYDEGGYDLLGPMKMFKAFVVMKPEDQLALLGSDLAPAASKESHSESRSRGRKTTRSGAGNKRRPQRRAKK